MSGDDQPIPGDQARVSVVVGVPPDVAFRIFTEEIELDNIWWFKCNMFVLKSTTSVGIGLIISFFVSCSKS